MTKPNNSLRSQVFSRVRQDILCGRYSQGEELTEAGLGAELGVSRTPVREALRQLELEGLVELIPNKGAFVTGITPKDVMDIYQIRARLEGLCARWAAENITDKELDDMEETMHLSEFHAKKEHYDKVFELDGRFHELMYEASHSRILAHELSDFHQYVQRVRRMSIKNRVRSQYTNEEHLRIFEALKQHDADLAEKLAHEHILNSMESIRRHDVSEWDEG